MAENPVFLTSERLMGAPGSRHGFFTRQGGVSTGVYASLNVGQGSNDDPQAVAANRARAAVAVGALPSALVTCHQVHSAVVLDGDGLEDGVRPVADGLVATRTGRLLGVLSADCAPVLFAAPKARAVAAVHAGWRGALGGVLEAAVRALHDRGASPGDIVAAVGPCIGPASYEVGEEFEQTFADADVRSVSFFARTEAPGKRLFDLPGYVLRRLADAGVSNAHWIGRDTCAEPSVFFSHRQMVRQGQSDYGRLLSVIELTA